jgi:hypothetical protein
MLASVGVEERVSSAGRTELRRLKRNWRLRMVLPIIGISNRVLTKGVGISFAENKTGWRFQEWHRTKIMGAQLPPPSVEDRERYFESAAAAAVHFQGQYADTLLVE